LNPLAELGDVMSCASGRMIGQEIVVWRDDPCGVPGYHLVVPTGAARAIWDHLLIRGMGVSPVHLSEATDRPAPTHGQDAHATQLGKRALRPIGWAAFNACRIEAGRAIFGIDFDDSILPAETGQMSRAVSLTKGCYPGQEIVARMHARQQVAKQLAGIRMDDEALPIAAAPIYDANQNAVGAVTSSTISPILSGAAIALGYVKRPLFAIGTKLVVPAEGQMRNATVVETPFR
jgi:folate-binding protein YgfZ